MRLVSCRTFPFFPSSEWQFVYHFSLVCRCLLALYPLSALSSFVLHILFPSLRRNELSTFFAVVRMALGCGTFAQSHFVFLICFAFARFLFFKKLQCLNARSLIAFYRSFSFPTALLLGLTVLRSLCLYIHTALFAFYFSSRAFVVYSSSCLSRNPLASCTSSLLFSYCPFFPVSSSFFLPSICWSAFFLLNRLFLACNLSFYA